MNRSEVLKVQREKELFEAFNNLHNTLSEAFKDQFDRSLPFNDQLLDRWERAEKLGFGKGASIYDSSYIFGKVEVGIKTWIGPFTIIDGSGGLTIGDHCTIASGVHIYSHDNVKQTLSAGKIPIERNCVSIGNNVYVGPQSIIKMGVKIGNFAVIGANSFINPDVPDYAIVAGNPAKIIGKVIIEGDSVKFEYNK